MAVRDPFPVGPVVGQCALLMVIFTVIAGPTDGPSWAWAAANSVLFVFAIVAALGVHEIGHAIVARGLGFEILGVRLGVGKRVARREWRGTHISVHAIPLNGVVYVHAERSHWLRLRYALVLLAGPGANLLFALSLWAIVGTRFHGNPEPLEGFAVAPQFFFANFFLGVGNLVPFLGGDGTQMIKLLVTRDDKVRENLALAKCGLRASWAREEGRVDLAESYLREGLRELPGNTRIMCDLASVLIFQRRYGDARSSLQELLQRTEIRKIERALLENNLAWTNLCLEDPALLDEAALLSQQAYRAFPNVPAFAGTRGAVLVELGDAEKGLSLLTRAFHLSDTPQSRSHNALWIAIGEARRGRAQKAREYLDLAKSLDPTNDLVARAEAAVLSEVPPPAVASGQASGGA